ARRGKCGGSPPPGACGARCAFQSAALSRRNRDQRQSRGTGGAKASVDRAPSRDRPGAPRTLSHAAHAHGATASSAASARRPTAAGVGALRASTARQRRAATSRLLLLSVPREHSASFLHAIPWRTAGVSRLV